jgi:hypothetical protein
MEVRLSTHAEQQIESRKLSRERVLEVAATPEQVIKAEGQVPVGQSRITHQDKPALMRVAFRDEGEIRLVVTAYVTTKVEKYWQEQP